MEDIDIESVRLVEGEGKEEHVLAQYPSNSGSGIILDKDSKIEIKINGNWEKLWELKISSRFV